MDLITFQKLSNQRKLALALRFAALGLALLLAIPFVGQQAATPQATSVVDDWSHHHLVFSSPGTLGDAVRTGTVDKWYKIISDTRYQMQQRRRSLGRRPVVAVPDFAAQTDIWSPSSKGPPGILNGKQALKKDWNTNLGSSAAASLTGVIGTLSGGISGTSTLTVDGVTFDASPPTQASASASFSANPTNGQTFGVSNSPNSETLTATGAAAASASGTFASEPSSGSTLTITGLGNTLILTANSSTSSSCTFTSHSSTVNFTRSSTASTDASRLAALISISGCGSAVGVGASATGAQVTITAVTIGSAGNNITVKTSSPNFQISAWTTLTNLAGGASLQSGSQFFAFTDSSGNALTTTQTAANLASAITNSTVGVTGSSTNAQVTITANTPGSSGNGITLTDALSNITWPATLTGGANGTTSGTLSPPTFAYWSGSTYVSSSQVATNIATAMNANSTVSAVLTAAANSPATNDLTLTAKTAGVSGNGSYTLAASNFSAFIPSTTSLSGGAAGVQPNTYPAKFSFSTATASCTSDFVVYPTGAPGATGAANIIAYNNLYTTGCTGTVPSVYWSYNTGTGYAVTTSPTISFDGSQVAFIQSNGATASLVLLKWEQNVNDSITLPEAPAVQSSASYRGCTAPCMYTITFSGTNDDTLSSPFYDYASDTLYVGDDNGNLHQFTGVFNGTPAENTTSPWPVNLGTNKLSSPVYDRTGTGDRSSLATSEACFTA